MATLPAVPAHIDTTPLHGGVRDLQPIKVFAVDRTPWDPVWDQLMRTHHYLGHGRLLGARVKHLVFSCDRPIAALGWRAAALKLAVRDRFIGWSQAQKRRHLLQVANNSRLLLLPWARLPHVASHVLARSMQALSAHWQAKYGQPLLLLETFVDPRHFAGTVYRATNWIYLGQTKGFGRDGPGYHYHGQPKEVYVYPLQTAFRTLIGCQQQPYVRERPRVPRQERKERKPLILHQNDWHPDLLEESGVTKEAVQQLGQKLAEFHRYFAPAFHRSEQRENGLVYLKGLLSDLQAKSAEPIALRYVGPSGVRNLQHFLGRSVWEEEQLLALYQSRLARLIAAEDGVVSVDSCEFPKKGKESVGVARQYCGRLGKVENCQSGVFVGYTSKKGYGLLDAQLYLPEPWFEPQYAPRREACQLPEDLTFQTKPRLALRLLERLRAQGLFAAGWIACDATFGNDSAFRDALAADGLYFAQVRANTPVWLEAPSVQVPVYSGRGRPPQKLRPLEPSCTVADVAADPQTSWQELTLAEGAKGPIVAQVARRRVVEARKGLPHQPLWLFMRRERSGELKFAFSNAPPQTPLEEMIRVSTMRWPLEQLFQEGKGQLGMDHYETRSWPAWHRHMLYVFLAMLFLLELRCQFVKRGPFCPS
ncbi:MAG: IS701 family transposase [Bacillota bacterium]